MASKIDIWNTALSHIGHKAQIADPDESSIEASHCRRFYPIALAMVLERFAWSFATRRAQLAEVDNPVDHWMFAYALPNLCVMPRAVLPPECTDDSLEQDYAVETDEDGDKIVYTNMENAVMRYTALVEDTTKFTPLFVLAVSAELGALLVGPIPKDAKKRREMQELAMYYTEQGAASDAGSNQRTSAYKNFIPSQLAVR